MKAAGKTPAVTANQAPRAGSYGTGKATPKIADQRSVKSGGYHHGKSKPAVCEGKTPAMKSY